MTTKNEHAIIMKTETKQNELIKISDLSYADSKKYDWKPIEKMQRKGNTWTQRFECKKTGAKGIRHGGFSAII